MCWDIWRRRGGKIGMGMLSYPGNRAWFALITDEIRNWKRMQGLLRVKVLAL